MSSEDSIEESSVPRAAKSGPSWSRRGLKVRETLRACDACRRRKVKCDAHTLGKGKCSTCETFKLDCTFNEEAKKRGLPKGYLKDLEERVRNIESLLERVAPDVDVEAEIGPSFDKDTWEDVKSSKKGGAGSKSRRSKKESTSPFASNPHRSSTPGGMVATADYGSVCFDFPPDALDVDLKSMSIMTELSNFTEEYKIAQVGTAQKPHYHGTSSGATLVEIILKMKSEPGMSPYVKLRPEFWRPNPWEVISYQTHPLGDLDWPEDDLMDKLVDGCFTRALPMYPILHRPSFERDLRARLHLKDDKFAAIVLLVCAIGSRFLDPSETRVLMKNVDGEYDLNSAGWGFILAMMVLHKPFVTTFELSDIQGGALAAIFFQGSNALHAPWVITGVFLRACMDHGAHREQVYGKEPADAFRNQIWKRVFWSLVTIDRLAASALGRTVAVFDEDIDAELPLEVDDEYYDEKAQKWCQPPDKPARMSAFVYWVKLNTIHAYAARTLYAINRSKAAFAVNANWEADTVAELDSALNAWEDNLPEHLKWNPNIKDINMLNLSAQLRIGLHYIQILIHRKFFLAQPGGKRSTTLDFASLAICGNSARSTLGVIEACDKAGLGPDHYIHGAAFTTATVLLVCMWDAKRSRSGADVSRYVADLNKCIKILHSLEDRWQIAGRLCDILSELASMSDCDTSPMDALKKRARELGDDLQSRRQNPFMASITAPTGASSVLPSSSASFFPSQAPMAAENPYPSIEASLMSLFGPTVDRDAALQWDPADAMFPYGNQLPIMDASWDNYVLSAVGNGMPGQIVTGSYPGFLTPQHQPGAGYFNNGPPQS